MQITRTLPSLLMIICAATVVLAQDPSGFTAPGPNIALHRPYTLDPAANYSDCSLDPELNLLTDGEYTKGYFWVQKTSVGWVNKRPVAITLDLGKVEPIAGLSFNTAAGVAGVTWPVSMMILTSDDARQWTVVGDLVTLSNKRGAPAASPYSVHRFWTGDLQARGRYVALVVDMAPYMCVDEVEVYAGKPEWLTRPAQGKQVTMSPLDYQKAAQVVNAMQSRLRTDLDAIIRESEGTALADAEKTNLRAKAEKLRTEIEAQDTVPEDFTTVLPLNDLHARVYALQAPVLRARGYKPLTVWGGYRYDMLQPLQSPAKPPTAPPVLSVRMMRNERRAEVLNLTNATDAAMNVSITPTGLGSRASLVTAREVLFTDTLSRVPVAAAILPATGKTLQLTIPAGMTRQVWVALDSRNIPAGEYKAALKIVGAKDQVTVPLTVRVANPTMPSEFSIAIGGWDETNNKGGYQVTAQNMMPLIRNLREHGVNMPWSNPQVMPTPGEYDADGNMTAPPNFASRDEWVERWKGAAYWGLFPSVKGSFAGEPMGTPRFNKMVGAWATAWVQHAAAQGIRPGQIMILLVDEPHGDEQDKIIIGWAKALHAAQPELVVWNDPTHKDPAKVDPEFYEQADVLCPNAPLFLSSGKAYQDFYLAQQQAGRELWFYSCSGPAKLLDPASYWRGQFWLNLKYGGKGSCYWAFGDEAGDSWNAYRQSRNCFSPLFLSKTTVTDAKQMEAIREGAEDYEYFRILRARVTELEAKGVQSRLLDQAKTLLLSAPTQAVEIMGGDKMKWTEPKDRALLDNLRLQALDMLEKLSKL
jgi:hypothetical protein